jgi:hypothetical protein
MFRFFTFVCIVFVTAAQGAFAMPDSAEIDAATARLMPKIIEWRRHVHQ